MRRKQGLTLGQALIAFLTQLPKMANQSRLTSISSNSPFSWNSHLSMNRSICDSRCSGFPVELEHSHIAIAQGLMHISLSIAPRPSPDHMRGLSFDQGNHPRCDDRAKTLIPKRTNPSRFLRYAGCFKADATEHQLSPEIYSLIGKNRKRLKGRSSSVRLSLRQPHYHRQYKIARRLVALRPALSQRYALIGESLFERS